MYKSADTGSVTKCQGSATPEYIPLEPLPGRLACQATEEAFNPQKRTSSTSKHEISQFFSILWVIFAFPGPDPNILEFLDLETDPDFWRENVASTVTWKARLQRCRGCTAAAGDFFLFCEGGVSMDRTTKRRAIERTKRRTTALLLSAAAALPRPERKKNTVARRKCMTDGGGGRRAQRKFVG
jgi:hypothetical protein